MEPFIDMVIFSMVALCQTDTTHIVRSFMPRTKLNFSLTGVAGGAPGAGFLLSLSE